MTVVVPLTEASVAAISKADDDPLIPPSALAWGGYIALAIFVCVAGIASLVVSIQPLLVGEHA